MFLDIIPENIFTTTVISIKYDCNGGSERCGKEWKLKYKDAKNNFDKNNGKHICRKCTLKSNNPMFNKANIEKIKQTNLKKYGVSCSMNTKEKIEERKPLYKDANFLKQRNKKRRKTSQDKYGTDHPQQAEVVKNKQRKTMLDKHGAAFPLQSPEIMEKMQQTNMDRYGVKNVAQTQNVQDKMKKTRVEKYGVEHYNQLSEMREYLRDNCPKWLTESWANPWAKGITRPEKWNQKQSETMTRLLLEGKLICSHKNSIRGYFNSLKCKNKEPFFRSHLELLTHYKLTNDKNVLYYLYEPFSIPFIDQKKRKRLYVPDFQVFYKNKKRPLILECKPEYMIKLKDNPSKFKFAQKFSVDNEFDFEIWNEKLIHQFGNYKEVLLLPQVKRIKNPC